MNKTLHHRGPDDEGIYKYNNCILGHKRLSIIDLSKDGHQPFESEDGNYILTFNGEIYNYQELKITLQKLGYTFKTQTDTEVLLKMYIHYGEKCLSQFNGMFAFVIYNKISNELFIARDRVGIKPFYYTFIENKFYFASEIKALKKVCQSKWTVNNQSVFDFLCFNRTDIFDETFYNEVKKLPKAHYGILRNNKLNLNKWWNPEDYLGQNSTLSEKEILEEVENILVSSVKYRMQSDVPIGSCLSGGLDSSIIIGIINKHFPNSAADYKTFTASFPGFKLDETSFVEKLNNRLSFKNYCTFPDAQTAFDNFNDFSYYNEEPVAGPSFYSQYEVMRIAKEHGVTVILDGQGGDENFAGYQYFHGFFLHGLLKQHKYARFLFEMLQMIKRKQNSIAYKTLMFQLLPNFLKKKVLYAQNSYIEKSFFDTYVKASRIFNEFFDTDSLNKSLVRHFQYKLEHLLRMEDRNSMAFSLESRVPYLDHRLIELVLSINDEIKIHKGHTKYLQKQAMNNYTIPEILDRKDKIGFGTPVDEWMQTAEWKNRFNEALLTINNKSLFNKQFDKKTFTPKSMWKLCSLSEWIENI